MAKAITLNIHDQDVQVFPQILAFFSPVIQILIQDDKLTKLQEEPSKLMAEYLMFFHPENRTNIQINIDATNVDELMSLSVKYQTSWFNAALECYILTKKSGSFEDSEFFEVENCKRNLKGILMAQKYQMHELEYRLLNFNFCPFSKLVTMEGFNELSESNRLKLALKRILHAVEEEKAKVIFKAFDAFVEATEVKESEDGVYLFHQNQADVVINCPKNRKIYAHSAILDFYSLKFKMSQKCLPENSQSKQARQMVIEMNEWPYREVETFFKMLYANRAFHLSSVKGRLDYNVLLTLTSQHDIKWMTDLIESHLILHYKSVIQPKSLWGDDVEMATLVVADKYALHKLRNNIIKKYEEPYKLFELHDFKTLSRETKYLIIRKCIRMYPSKENGQFSEEGQEIVRFMDKYYK